MEYEIKPQNKFSLGLEELWLYRELFYFFTWRDIKVKYKQTSLGFAWAILQPLTMMLVFSVFFGKALNVPSEGIPYPVFVFSGLLLWNVFSSGLSGAANSMVANANIIKKIYFPRLIIPISTILVSAFDFLMAFIIYIGVLIYYQFPISILKLIILLPISLFLTVIGTFGLGCLLSALNVKYRDFRYVIPFMIQLLLFLTPVIYPISIFKQKWLQLILSFNPMYAPIHIFRSVIIPTPMEMNFILNSISSSVILFIMGIYIFRKTEAYFADIA